MLVEQLEYNLLFRWFVGLNMTEPAWNHAVFSKNRERLLAGDVAHELFACVVEQARALKRRLQPGPRTKHHGGRGLKGARTAYRTIHSPLAAPLLCAKTTHKSESLASHAVAD